MKICKCNNPECCISKQLAQVKKADRKGTKNSKAKLNDEKVVEIRRLRKEGHTLKALSKRFGVAPARIWEIANYKSWIHIA